VGLEESLPVGADLSQTSSDNGNIMSIPLTSADDETTVMLADYFHRPPSCYQFLVVVLLRHFA